MQSVYLITGATGGLGKAFATECASRGWNLFLTDLYEERLALLARGLERTYGVEVAYHPADLANVVSRDCLFARFRATGQRFRGLINVAGLDHEGLFTERRPEDITAILRLNVESTLMTTHNVLEFRDHALTFRIITVSSLAAFFSMPVKATYAASKRFLLDFSLALRNELRDENVTVTALCPAGMPTNDACIAAIEAQGLGGQLTTENVGRVAYQTVEAALRGKAIVIPGPFNRLMRWAAGFIPASYVAELIGSRWRAARLRRTDVAPALTRRAAESANPTTG